MSASVTGSVVSCPCSTMPSESPIRRLSRPAASSIAAKLASQQVSTAIFTPSSRSFCSALMVNRVILVSPVEKLAVAAHRARALDEQVEVVVLAHEIEPLGVHDQHGTRAVMVEETAVAVGEQGEIFPGDRPLEFYAAPAHAFVQDLRLSLQVDDQIGLRGLRLERVVYLLVQIQLFARERQAREQRVLLEEKIADGEPGEEVHLSELPQLAYPLEKEEKLRRKREAGPVLVEARQERVLLRALQDQGRVQAAGQALGEARLANANRPFDYDVVIFRERHEARARGKGRPSYTRRKRARAGATATDRRFRRARAAPRRGPGGSAGNSARAGRPRSRRIRASPRDGTAAGRLRCGTPPCRRCRRKPPKACRRRRASAPSRRPGACLPPESSPECAPPARSAPRRSARAIGRFPRGEIPRRAARRRPRRTASRRRRRAVSRRACADRRAV